MPTPKNYVRKWIRQPDGLFHCNQCDYTHKRASSVGRHAVVHSGQPYSRSPGARRPAGARSKGARSAMNADARRAYWREEARRRRQRQAITRDHNRKETSNGSQTATNTYSSQEFENTSYYLAGGWAKDAQGAARALGCSVGELTQRIFQIMRATLVR